MVVVVVDDSFWGRGLIRNDKILCQYPDFILCFISPARRYRIAETQHDDLQEMIALVRRIELSMP